MIDSYYVTLVYVMTFIKNKGIDINGFTKNVQWLAESFYKDGALEYFESCNQESIKNALKVFIKQGILTKTGQYVELADQYQENEGKLIEILEYMNQFRSKPKNLGLKFLNEPANLLRRSMLIQFPFMAKL